MLDQNYILLPSLNTNFHKNKIYSTHYCDPDTHDGSDIENQDAG